MVELHRHLTTLRHQKVGLHSFLSLLLGLEHL